MLRKLIFLAGLGLALTPFVLFPVCEKLKPDGTHMACWYSALLITLMGALIMLVSFVKKFDFTRLILTSLFALSCWVIPNKIINIPQFGLCADYEHSCRAETMPVTGALVMLIVILCAVELVIKFVKGK